MIINGSAYESAKIEIYADKIIVEQAEFESTIMSIVEIHRPSMGSPIHKLILANGWIITDLKLY